MWFCQGSALLSLSTHTKPPQGTTWELWFVEIFRLNSLWHRLPCSVPWTDHPWGWVPKFSHFFWGSWAIGFLVDVYMSPSSMVMTKQERRAVGAIIRNFNLHTHVGLGQVSGPVWKYVMGIAGGQKCEKKGERAKGWGAQSSALPAASPLWICSPPHPKYKDKKDQADTVQCLHHAALQNCRQNSAFVLMEPESNPRSDWEGNFGWTGWVMVLELHRCWLRTAAQDGAGHQPCRDFPHN